MRLVPRAGFDRRLMAVALQFRPLLLLFGGTFGSAVFAMAAQLLLTRVLSVSDYGRLTTVLAAVNLLSPVAAFGVNWFWVQVFGREGYGGFRWVRPSFTLLTMTNGLSVVLLTGYVLLAAGFPDEARGQAAWMACFMLLGQCAVEIASARFQLEERFGLLTLWQALPQIGRFVVAVTLLATSAHALDGAMLGYGLIGLGLTVAGLLILRRFRAQGLQLHGHVRPDATGAEAMPIDPPRILTAAKRSLPFAFITIFYLIYFQSAILLIAIFLGSETTAIFSAALLILSAIHLVPNILFNKLLVTRICRWAEHDRERFLAILHLSVGGMILVGVVAAVVIAVAAPLVVPLMFGEKYAAATQVVVWLTPTIPLRFVQSAYSAMLISEENVKRRVRYAGVSAACSLAVNLVLLPVLGLAGAVLASILSEAVLLVLNAWGVARHVEGVRWRESLNPVRIRAATSRILRGEPAPP